MKKLSLCLLLACIFCSTLVFSACSSNASSSSSSPSSPSSSNFISSNASSNGVEKSENAVGAEVAQADLEKMVIGKWITADMNGKPILTNDKVVFTFTSPTKASISASLDSRLLQ